MYDNKSGETGLNISIREALADIVQDLKESKANVSVRGSINVDAVVTGSHCRGLEK